MQSLTPTETPSNPTCTSEIFTQSESCEQDAEEREMQSEDALVSSTPSENNLDTFAELHDPVRSFY